MTRLRLLFETSSPRSCTVSKELDLDFERDQGLYVFIYIVARKQCQDRQETGRQRERGSGPSTRKRLDGREHWIDATHSARHSPFSHFPTKEERPENSLFHRGKKESSVESAGKRLVPYLMHCCVCYGSLIWQGYWNDHSVLPAPRPTYLPTGKVQPDQTANGKYAARYELTVRIPRWFLTSQLSVQECEITYVIELSQGEGKDFCYNIYKIHSGFSIENHLTQFLPVLGCLVIYEIKR